MPAIKIGHNIKIFDKEDAILIRISKDHEQLESSSGKSMLLANSGGFKAVEELTGETFEGFDVGLNLVLSLRPTKNKNKQTSKTQSKKKS